MIISTSQRFPAVGLCLYKGAKRQRRTSCVTIFQETSAAFAEENGTNYQLIMALLRFIRPHLAFQELFKHVYYNIVTIQWLSTRLLLTKLSKVDVS